MTDHVREITKLFEQARYRHDMYPLFSDAVEAMALAISNRVDLGQHDAREQRYMQIVGRYDRDVIEMFPKIMGHVAMALEERIQDVLGRVFHEMDLHNEARGQFFTPYDLARMMAEMTVDAEVLKETVDRRGFVTVHEPAAGSGAMVIAVADAMREQGFNYQQQLHVTAIDIDQRACHMAFVQLSLMHIPAVVLVGDTLSNEMREAWYTPAHVLGGWSQRLRMVSLIDATREAVELAAVETKPTVKADIEVPQVGEQMSLLAMIEQETQSRGGGIGLER